MIIVGLAAVLMGPAAAQAQRNIDIRARTAGELAELCATKPGSGRTDAEINYCHGFAQGTADVLLGTARGKKPFCFPTPPPTRTVTLNQFVEWVRAIPEHAKLPAAQGLAMFLGERYPCK